MRYIVLICLLFTLFFAGCNQSVRDGYQISPPPTDNENILFEASIDALSDAIRSNPSVAENYYKRAAIYFDKKQWEETSKDIERAIQLNPTNAAYLLLKSQSLLEQNKMDEAWQLINQVESYKLQSPDFYLTKAKLSVFKKDTTAVKSALAQLEQSIPYSSELFLVRGKYLEQLVGDTLSAMQVYHKAIKFDKSNTEPYVRIIDYLVTHNRTDSALALTKIAQVEFVNDSRWKIKQAEILQAQGFLEQSWWVYNTIFNADSTNTSALENMAQIRIKQKGYSAAIKHLTEASKLKPDNADYFYQVGFCYEQLRNFSKAQTNYQNAVRLNPQLRVAEQGLERTTQIVNSLIGLN